METEDKVRENYLRRYARRLGLILIKSRARSWSYDNQQGYMIMDEHNTIRAGEKFNGTLDMVEKFLEDYEADAKR